jgi:L-aminopeptidase/D-esterase-like protein
MRPAVDSITDVPGVLVGHADDPRSLTGCTVVLCPQGAVPGLDRRGGATSTRQADVFEPWHVVDKVHAVLLSGGSAFGLGAHDGVMQYLEEQGIGFGMGAARVPIVGTAALFDLLIGEPNSRPSAAMGYAACAAASADAPAQGCAGAGMGATVGKARGLKHAMKGGIGSASVRVGHTDLVVGAIVAVNAFGDVVDPATGRVLAGVRDGNGRLGDTLQIMHDWADAGYPWPPPRDNTVIGVVATNGQLTKQEATRVAAMAQDGLARAVRPAHTAGDGDAIFTLATGVVPTQVSVVGAMAAEVFARAIVRAIAHATSMGGLPAARDLG